MTEERSSELARLERVLDIYGADQSRWPAHERAALLALISRDVRARRLLAEARSLDRVLSAAPEGSPSERLARSIVAAAIGDGDRRARVVPIEVMRSGPPPRREPHERPRLLAPAAVMLAASFAVGVYLGAAILGQSTFAAGIEISGLDNGEGVDINGLYFNPDDLGGDRGGLL